jgi:hypothetical protein
VHGILELCNATTDEERVDAGVEIASGALGLGGMLGLGTGPIGGAIAIEWVELKWSLHTYEEALDGVIGLWESEAFHELEQKAKAISDRGRELCAAGILAVNEPDPAQRALFAQVVTTKAADAGASIDSLIDECQDAGDGDAGAAERITSYPRLVAHLVPLAQYRGAREPDEVRIALPKVLEIVTWCLSNQQELVQEEANSTAPPDSDDEQPQGASSDDGILSDIIGSFSLEGH